MSLRTRVLPSMLLILVLSACGTGFFGGERGSGTLVTETRDVGTFDSIDVGSAVNLEVEVDRSATPSVTVTYDDNIVDNVVTRVRNGTLGISLDGNINLTGNANRIVSVVTPSLEFVTASGAVTIAVAGSISSLGLDVSGASRVDLTKLEVGDVALNVSGASKVVVEATGVISGSASGASHVEVHGNPTSVRIETSGASSVDLP